VLLFFVVLQLMARAIMNNVRKVIHPEISIKQYGFGKDAGTQNAIFTIKTIEESKF